MFKVRCTMLCLVPVVFLVAGCAGEAVSFNNSIAKVNKDLNTIGRTFGETIAKESDPARLDSAHNEAVTKVKALVTEANAIKVPQGKEAQDFWTSFQTFLKNQEKMINEDFKELVTIKKSPNFQKAQWEAVFIRIQAVENADLANLKSAQAAYARANNLKIK